MAQSDPELARLGSILARGDLDERIQQRLVAKVLSEAPLLLVLDDFEQNLTSGGEAFNELLVTAQVKSLFSAARKGRVLVTCRYPIPDLSQSLHDVHLGPLQPSEVRRLVRRLPGLRGASAHDLGQLLRTIGGHPRVLELLDALLRGGAGRLPAVTSRLEELRAGAGRDGASTSPSSGVLAWDEAVAQVIVLGSRDILLAELLELARRRGHEEALLQLAASSLPVSPSGLAHMLAGAPSTADVTPALAELDRLSLAHIAGDGSAWVHRWTAQGITKLVGEGRMRGCWLRAGHYRWWRVDNETHELGDAIESMRNFLAAAAMDEMATVAMACADAAREPRGMKAG